jgi:putative ABC transport system permease protein
VVSGLWLRWVRRDLRHHYVAVIVIALVLAIGTGVYAGLGSTSTWRRQSNDASFAALNMHDLRVSLSPGTFAPEGALLRALDGTASRAQVTGANERLVVDSQIDASTGTEPILVVARLEGADLGNDERVDGLWVRDGTVPTEANAGAGLLEAKFADHWSLEPEGALTVAGGESVEYTGLAISPEDFFYEGPEGTLFAEGDLAPLYLPLATAQSISGRPGEVNDLVLTVAAGGDREAIEGQLAEAMASAGFSAEVTTREESPSFRVLYEDIENDQRFWNALALLVLLSAALAAFNLVSRIVESQRREIGIGMALGVSRSKLAIRPMVVGLQVAVLGVILGVGVGLLVGRAMTNLLESFLPLPFYETDFQFGVFSQAAALGLVIPLLAAAIPVWRALRVEPIDAIRTGHLTAKTSRLTDWTSRVRLPGSSLNQIPFRNVLRTPRRTVLTALGVGAAITALVAVLGMLDSFSRTIDQTGAELTKADEDRILVQLDTFYPAGSNPAESPTIDAIAAAGSVGAIDAGLRVPATGLTAEESGEDVDLLLELVDFDNAAWTPTIVSDQAGDDVSEGIILSRKAADDMGVRPGDTLVLRHPLRSESGAFTLTETGVTVAGLHANPLRPFAFMDLGRSDMLGLAGAVNVVHAYPTADASRADVQRDVFGLAGVTSSQAVARVSESFDQALEQFVGFLFITAVAVLILALLIAFNATRITIEERRREHATMRAFGLPSRTVVAAVVKESVLVGVAATVVGVIAGTVFLGWMLRSLTETTVPDLRMDIYLSPTTVALAAVVGIVAVAATPLFLVGRVRNMSIPDTLRMME